MSAVPGAIPFIDALKSGRRSARRTWVLRVTVKRLAQFTAAFFGVTILVFVMLRAAPGDAARLYLGERAIDISEETVARARRELGLDRPPAAQYLSWLAGVARLDWGVSSATKEPVVRVIAPRLRVSALLALPVLAAIVLAAFPLGLCCALGQRGAFDTLIRAAAVALGSVPSFCAGILLILFFSVKFRVLPSFGAGSAVHYLMPGLTLALGAVAYYTRLVRSSFLEEFSKEYIRSGRARGIRPLTLARSAAKNAALPVISSLGLSLAHLLGGQAVVEKLFGLPGMGSCLIDSVMRRDYAVTQGCVLVYVLLFSLINLAADLFCLWLDPKIRAGKVPL